MNPFGITGVLLPVSGIEIENQAAATFNLFEKGGVLMLVPMVVFLGICAGLILAGTHKTPVEKEFDKRNVA